MTPSPTKELMSATPTISRRPREEFAEQGAIIREVEDGVRCEQCKSDCPGFAAHDWR
uniref:CG32171-PA n=1 Tax=Drosophila erecta TaxID=7220 RepID=Q8I1H6_DROER|nr:CG32171-PA [Drosophila erecta]